MIDGFGVNGPAILCSHDLVSGAPVQWGLVQWYALVMVAGLVRICVYYVWK